MLAKFFQFNRYEIIYLSFALDSMLKVGYRGIKIHLGLLAIVILSFGEILVFGDIIKFRIFAKKCWAIFPFLSYMILSYFFRKQYPGATLIITYYFLGILTFYFFYKKAKYISNDAIIWFQWLLVISGLFQFILFKTTGYQLVFFDHGHYSVSASFATRLRGFFLEPNWYSIIITINTLLVIHVAEQKKLVSSYLIWLTIFCFLFNGSYMSVIIIGLIYGIETLLSIYQTSKKKIILVFFFILFIISVGLFRIYVGQSKMSHDYGKFEVNISSRLGPISKTIEFMSYKNLAKQLFGYGLGSWPYIGLSNNLGYLGYFGEREIKPGKRDSTEIQVFILEMGYISLIFLLFDYVFNYFKYRKTQVPYTLACGFLTACFFVYPIFYFLMYLIPFYILRSKSVTGRYVS